MEDTQEWTHTSTQTSGSCTKLLFCTHLHICSHMLAYINNALIQANKQSDEVRHSHTYALTLWALIGCNNLMDRHISRCVNSVSHRLVLYHARTPQSLPHVCALLGQCVCLSLCVHVCVCVFSTCKRARKINKQADCQQRCGGGQRGRMDYIHLQCSQEAQAAGVVIIA